MQSERRYAGTFCNDGAMVHFRFSILHQHYTFIPLDSVTKENSASI